jgi:hypothetical protein
LKLCFLKGRADAYSYNNVALQRFYRTLSDIKGEVENIIKTGRKLVEDKAVSDPPAFSAKIDALKELYNKV